MAGTVRTFVAIPLPEPVVAALIRLTDRLGPQIAGARWVSPRQYHVTLAFLGDVAAGELPVVCQAVDRACQTVAPFSLRVARLGAFPNLKQPRVLWVGLTGGALPALDLLHEQVVNAIETAGYPVDSRFAPHITLARFKPGRSAVEDLTDFPGRNARWTGGELNVHEVVTYSSSSDSRAGSTEPIYTPLARAALLGEDPVPEAGEIE